MGFLDKLKYQLDNAETKAKKSHVKNLFLVALADGRLENIEFDFILHVADNLYLDRQTVREIHGNLNDISFFIPTHEKQRLDQIYDLVSLALVDGELNDQEILVCKNIAIQFGYRPVVVELMIKSIVDAVVINLAKEFALNRLLKLLN
jgi:Tellurite resistance protein TerB.